MTGIFKPNDDVNKYVQPAPAPPVDDTFTVTPNLGLTKPLVGGDADAWGEILNTDLDLIDQKVATITAMNAANSAQDAVIATKADKSYVDSQDATLNALIGTKAPIDSPNFTGNPLAPTAPDYDNDASLANTAFVQRALGISPIIQIGGNVTIGPTHLNGATLLVTGAGVVITVPDDQTAIPIGTRIDVINWDSGATTTFSPGSGVGLGSPDSKRRMTKAYAAASLTKVSGNLWHLVGELVT